MKEATQTHSHAQPMQGDIEAETGGKYAKAPAFGLVATEPPPSNRQGTRTLDGGGSHAVSGGILRGVRPSTDITVPDLSTPDPDAVESLEPALTPSDPQEAVPKTPAAPGVPPAPRITVRTALPAPDGSGRSRLRVGVGEQVRFSSTIQGNWTASAGDPAVSAAATRRFDWQAPNRATNATIAVTTAAGGTANVVMEVLEPSSITPRKLDEMSFPAGVAGAGMHLRFDYNPMTVSFGNVEAAEDSGPASNVTGYFSTYSAADLHHDSGDTFLRIGNDNRDTAIDEASASGDPAPWSAGGFDWIIPNRFRVVGEAGRGQIFTHVTQSFRIAANGGFTVSKGAESAFRMP
jgi:hypothetical protein